MLVKIGRYPKGDTERKISVRIDKWDTWGADHTMALVIAPLLQQLKKDRHGSALVDDADVPEHLKSTSAPPKENDWDTDDNLHLRWDYVLDEMIWAMQEIVSNKEGENQFYDYSEVNESEDVMQQINKMKVDHEGLILYQTRIQKGCELFGKYFQGLWT